ncbi:MAG: hypothetical protein IPM69_19050 [Ignavibacteria bacterium]|nr:hypothetical protein [Ignavibacteria bacterium]
MWKDEIVSETRAVREEYARQLNFDVKLIAKDMQAKQKKHERMMASPDKPSLTDEQRSPDV